MSSKLSSEEKALLVRVRELIGEYGTRGALIEAIVVILENFDERLRILEAKVLERKD